MLIDREDKSREQELKVNSFDGKLMSLKNMMMTELTHTKDNLLQEPKKIMRDFEINVKHIYDMKFKSLETQFIGIIDEQAKLNRITQQDYTKRQEDSIEYYNKLDSLVHQHTERQEGKMKNVIDDILSKFNKMEDTFLELFKQKEKLFERMNLGYEHLFSNQEIIESSIKKIIYTLDRKADNLSVRTYLKNLDTKFEDFQNSVAFQNPLRGDTGVYLKEKTNQSGLLENINTLNISDLKTLEGDHSVAKLINKTNTQAVMLKALKETQQEQEKRIDHLEEISMNMKIIDQQSQFNQMIPNLKQRVPIYTNDDHSNSINQTPFSNKNKQNSRNNSPQIDQTYSQNFVTDAKSSHQKSDNKDKDSQYTQNRQVNSILNDIFNKKSNDKIESQSISQNKPNVSRNLIYEAYDQSSSPQLNRVEEQRGKTDQGNKNTILQNNFVSSNMSEVQERNDKLPMSLEYDEGEDNDLKHNKNNGIDDIEKLKLIKTVAQDRMTSTNVLNRMRQNFDQKEKNKNNDKSNKGYNKKDENSLLQEAEPLDQGFMDTGEEILTNSLKKSINKKEDNQKQSKKPSLLLQDMEQNSYNKKNNQIQFTQAISPPPEDDDQDEGTTSGGGLRSLLNKSKKRSDISRETSPIQNQRSNSRNNQQASQNNFSHLNEINLLNQEYKSQLSNNSSQYNNKSQQNYHQNSQSNIPNYLQKNTLLDNKSNLSKGQYGNNFNRQGEYYDGVNSEVYENPLDRRSPLPRKQDMSNSSLLRNKQHQLNQQKTNDLPPLNIKSAKEIQKPKSGLQQKNNFGKGINQQSNNNKNKNQYQNKGSLYDQNNQNYEEEDDEEVVYQIDEDGFLMDEQGEYLRDEQGNFIRLSPDQLDNLRDQNLVVEEDLY